MLDTIIRENLEDIARQTPPVAIEEAVITGGAGFLGSWLCDTFIHKGSRVLCVDNLSTGRRDNIEHLIPKENFRFQQGDVAYLDMLDGNPDLILHLASRASPEEYQQHPIETLEANSTGTKKALELARKYDAALLYASSSEVYGEPEVIPTPETYPGRVDPIGPRSCYEEGKRFGEALCTAYQEEYGLDVRIARIFNSYGPRIRADGAYARAIPRFIAQALAREPITVYGDGTQTRSFCYVTDTVEALLLTATKDEARGEVINLGNPTETRIVDLAEEVRHLTDSSSEIGFQELPEGDPKRRRPDITKAHKLLNWTPKVPLTQGLKRTIAWFQLRPDTIETKKRRR